MSQGFELVPEGASTLAPRVDALHIYVLVTCSIFAVGVAVAILVFSIRYRRRSGVPSATELQGSVKLEALWGGIPLVLSLTFFFWGAKLYFETRTPPSQGMEFYVTGKQWMWKIQHPTGQREVNALHVPVGEVVKLTMTSEDVIHSFYIPAFRVKYDVLPGRYTRAWFQATKAGEYHLFCAEYCGTKHSEMIGTVTVLEPDQYERWLEGQPEASDPVEAGAAHFERLRCNTCHEAGAEQRGPRLEGIFGKPVQLTDGRTLVRDENYLRRSILEPNADVVAGYLPQMPTYEGQVSEEELLQLVAYIRSLEVSGEEGSEDIDR